MIREAFGDNVLKECTGCSRMAEFFPEYSAWYCHACEQWC